MAFGAPEGAAGATAYSLEIAGVDGSGARSLGRGIAAVALFAIGAVVAGLLGRRTA
jgi:putative membrane protein